MESDQSPAAAGPLSANLGPFRAFLIGDDGRELTALCVGEGNVIERIELAPVQAISSVGSSMVMAISA